MDSKTKQGQQQQSFTTQTKGSDDVRHSLLQATLAHVPEHGWTMESISQGAAELGFPSVVHGVFPGGPAGLVDTYLEDCQQRFVQLMASGPEQYWHPNASMTDKVRALTVLRLNMLKPYARRWPEAVSILAVPSNLPMAMHHLSQVVDDIWYYAGDRSPDMNWYTKRVSLATIYSATELYMSQDISPEYVETYRFLDRRLNQAEWLDATSRQVRVSERERDE
ncbi:rpsU-divergently transcribed protein [Halteromyces radiatus]|uniref:rpsU-divergently transcribed protein n=1 Tax=Halteromyces radiatus TaxID=101107 RepID=UPI00221F6714|nr:rpsU-divergently transcribed protein [Halteromyces radiatus]KAI8093899.1 rpsU-divergently transcribed protein [Halteromyces radiatus]